MCGIAGVISDASVDEGRVEQLTQMLSHRGPDGDGIVSTSRGVLGHRRLAILDLTHSGAQPMWDSQKRCCITFNGEIYNWRELRAEAARRGASFQSDTDTEVILNLYALDGVRAFSRLQGMFAFCLYDAESGTAYLVRDRAGIKPLYVAPTAEALYFASELGPLIESGVVPFEVDNRSLQSFLRLDYVPTPWSLLSGVRKLNAGEVLECTRRGERSLLLEPLPVDRWSGDRTSALAEFERRIEFVVERQLVADVPVGVFLSGGLDSTIIARTAMKLRGSVDTFSIGFAEASFDESEYARAVASQLGSRHHEHVVEAADLIDTVVSLPSIISEPVADGSILPTFALCAFARKHVTVALSGDGADELFGGYPLYRIPLAGRVFGALPGAAVRVLDAAVTRLPVRYENLTTAYKAHRFLRGLSSNYVLRHHRWLGTFLPEQLPALMRQHETSYDTELDLLLTGAVAGSNGVAALMRSDERFYLQDQVLVKTDRASMANSLEIRVPFLDEEMVAFAHALPTHLKVTLARSKVLLREFLMKEFPPQICKRAKKGFGAPLGKWFRGPLRELLHDTLGSMVRNSGFFNTRYVERLLQEHEGGVADHRKELFNLLAFGLWYEFWKDRGIDGRAR